ncbi:DUF2971 domain-containing protein [Enterobacter asburiae]|jgi:hypothetical protein|nr:DUF2971 domain-containing protein [Enterobacter asburiae]
MPTKEEFFKYLSSETAITVIENFSLKYSNTLDFNDPFDYNPALESTGLSKFMKRVSNDFDMKISRKQVFQNSKILTTEGFRRQASRDLSVTCFSKSPHIVPMWAHYGNCHQGCVLGFSKASHNDLASMLNTDRWRFYHDSDYLIPEDVRYTNDRPTIFDSQGLTNTLKNGADACLIKAKAWEYEQEVRVLKIKPAGIYPFEKSQLRSVRFGLNVDPKIRAEIIRLVDSIRVEHKISIRLFDLRMDHRQFLLNDIKC